MEYIKDSKGNITKVVFEIDEFKELKIDQYVSEHFSIPEWQKNEIKTRIKEAEKNPSLVLNWDDVKDSITLT